MRSKRKKKKRKEKRKREGKKKEREEGRKSVSAFENTVWQENTEDFTVT